MQPKRDDVRRSRFALALGFLCLALTQATRSGASENTAGAADDVAQYRQLEKLLVDIRQHNAEQVAITDPMGIDEAGFVKLGGIEQWVKIRGHNRGNPVLLFVHGGPGHVTNPWSYAVLAPWEEHFTVVQWDQRGAGRTFGRNGPEIVQTMTLKRMVQDGIELAQRLCRRLDKDKIIVVAHSFGTILGLRMIAQRPDLFSAYVGTGQVADNRRATELAAYQALLAAAHETKNQRAVADLTRNGPPPYESDTARITQRKWANALEGADRFLFATLGWTLAAPDGSARDINDTAAGERASAEQLVPQTGSLGRRELGLRFSVPIFFFQGMRDYTTPTGLARQYLESIQAPHKELVLIEGGHFAVFTNADAFLRELIRRVRPLATAPADRK